MFGNDAMTMLVYLSLEMCHKAAVYDDNLPIELNVFDEKIVSFV